MLALLLKIVFLLSDLGVLSLDFEFSEVVVFFVFLLLVSAIFVALAPALGAVFGAVFFSRSSLGALALGGDISMLNAKLSLFTAKGSRTWPSGCWKTLSLEDLNSSFAADKFSFDFERKLLSLEDTISLSLLDLLELLFRDDNDEPRLPSEIDAGILNWVFFFL